MLYLATQDVMRKWTGRIQNWGQILHHRIFRKLSNLHLNSLFYCFAGNIFHFVASKYDDPPNRCEV